MVSESRWLPSTLCPTRHSTNVSDSQDVCSHALDPVLSHGEGDACPKLAPCTVMLADPVPARLAPLAWLIALASIENERVRHPAWRPAVSSTRWLPATPPPTWHRTDVSDSHVDRSHPVPQGLAAGVYDPTPMPRPCKVRLDAPVAAPLVHTSALNESWSAVKTRVADLMRAPTLSKARLLPVMPCAPWHRTDVSDSHVDRSPLVCPSAPNTLYPAGPMLAPCTVTLADPVAARLALPIPLTMLASCDIPALMLPCLTPLLIVTWRVPITPCPAWHRIDVSASHVVRSHPVLPTRTDPVCVASPSPDPCTVTLDDPVAARFVRPAPLGDPISAE